MVLGLRRLVSVHRVYRAEREHTNVCILRFLMAVHRRCSHRHTTRFANGRTSQPDSHTISSILPDADNARARWSMECVRIQLTKSDVEARVPSGKTLQDVSATRSFGGPLHNLDSLHGSFLV